MALATADASVRRPSMARTPTPRTKSRRRSISASATDHQTETEGDAFSTTVAKVQGPRTSTSGSSPSNSFCSGHAGSNVHPGSTITDSQSSVIEAEDVEDESLTSWHTEVLFARCQEGVCSLWDLCLPDHARVQVRGTGLNHFVIHPDNRVKKVFDYLVAYCVLYVCLTVPVKATWNVTPSEGIDVMIDVIFLLDVFLQLLHGFYDRGFPVLELRFVAYRYATTWMPLDLLASLPYERIASAAAASSPEYLRALSLFKCLRVVRLPRLFKSMQLLTGGTLIRVCLTLLVWVMVAHLFANAWFALGWYPNRCVGGRFERTWVGDFWPELQLYCPAVCNATAAAGIATAAAPTAAYRCPPPSPRPEPGDGSVVAVSEMYIMSFYWALSTMSSMGYGRGPAASHTVEFILAIVAQITGACLYAAIFGNIAQLIQKFDAPGARYNSQLDRINEFVEFHRLPATLSKKLHDYNNFLFRTNRGFNVEQISAALPLHLRQEVFLHLHEHLVRKVRFLISSRESSLILVATDLITRESPLILVATERR